MPLIERFLETPLPSPELPDIEYDAGLQLSVVPDGRAAIEAFDSQISTETRTHNEGRDRDTLAELRTETSNKERPDYSLSLATKTLTFTNGEGADEDK